MWIIGASSGIGEALAYALIERGARLILSARREELLQNITSQYPSASALPFDIKNEQAWRVAEQSIKAKFDGLDLIIFCAARYQPERSWELRMQDVQQTIATNLNAVYQGLCTQVPAMIAQGSGGIAIIASVAGYVGLPNASVYGPSKAALINLSELLYADLHPQNINVYLINPGFVSTELTAKNHFFMPAIQTPKQAAHAILLGMEKGQFEIHFPRRFTYCLKLLQMLPYRLRFAFIKAFITK